MVKKILIVDKDVDHSQQMASQLASRGYDVSCVHDAKQGFVTMETYMPDLIVMDPDLPDTNGYDFLDSARRSASWRAFVVVTTLGGEFLKKELEAYERKADYFIEKPFRPARLFTIVDYLIGNITDDERERLGSLI